MVSPYWFNKFELVIILIVGLYLAFRIVFELCCWFAAWRRQRRTMIGQGYPVKEIPKERSNTMRKHTENAKAEEATTGPENEVQQDATPSETAKLVGDLPKQPVDLKAGPVNVADLKPGSEVDPLLGDKADVLAFLSQLTEAIDGAGIINGKYFEGFFISMAKRIEALEAAVMENSKQTTALSVDINRMIDLFGAAQEG